MRFIAVLDGEMARGSGGEGIVDVEVDCRSQPSNIVERRFCESVARQSPELVFGGVGEAAVAAGFFLAVPSSSSSSSSAPSSCS